MRGTLSYQLLEDLDASEALSIETTKLNACKLGLLSAVDIAWTSNVSRHMLLTKKGGRHVLELFSLPCALDILVSSPIGLSEELKAEIRESYAMLFNAWTEPPLHARLGSALGVRAVCWCWYCAAHRYRQRCILNCRGTGTRRWRKTRSVPRNSEFDPMLEELMLGRSMSDWMPNDFPHLWMRIVRLEHHLQTSRPWSIWVLFRDRRDTMQFWTFL